MMQIKPEDLIPGKLYRMVHSRKGKAVVECVTPFDDGGDFIVREGILRGMQDEYGPGDKFTTVNNLAKFYEKV